MKIKNSQSKTSNHSTDRTCPVPYYPNPVPSNPQPATIRREPSRRERRAPLHNLVPCNNDGTFKNSRTRTMMRVWNDQAIFIPRRRKLKGYIKEAIRQGHRKTRAA